MQIQIILFLSKSKQINFSYLRKKTLKIFKIIILSKYYFFILAVVVEVVVDSSSSIKNCLTTPK